MYARNTNDRPHPVAACRVGRETLVSGGPSFGRGRSTVSHTRVRRRVIAPVTGELGRGLRVRRNPYAAVTQARSGCGATPGRYTTYSDAGICTYRPFRAANFARL